MTFERFKRIVEYNVTHQKEIEEKTRDFRGKLGVMQEHHLKNLLMFVRPMLEKEKYIFLEIPFADQEIGAVSYKRETGGYVFLNSSLPRMNVNFALAHELYHIWYQKKNYGRKIELYMSEAYGDYEEEQEANLFAGILMMPATVFQYMLARFAMEQTKEDSELTIFVKLMSYFEVPYMAVLIRCYELHLLPEGKVLQYLLEITKEDIKKEFSRLWLDEAMLCPTLKEEYGKFRELLETVGRRNVENELMDEQNVGCILKHMDSVYKAVRRKNYDEV